MSGIHIDVASHNRQAVLGRLRVDLRRGRLGHPVALLFHLLSPRLERTQFRFREAYA